MLPPSKTTGRACPFTLTCGSQAGKRSRSVIAPAIAVSSFQSLYLAQALKRHAVAATAGKSAGRAGIAPKKDWARVASPASIGRNVVKANCAGRFARRRGFFGQNAGANQQLADLGFCFHVLNQHIDALHPRQLANDFRIHPRDRREPARPVASVVRPCDPCRLVGFPLGWHAVAESSWGLRKFPELGHSSGYTRNLCVIGPYASTRRSRQKGQFRRTSSIRCRSTSAMSTSSAS